MVDNIRHWMGRTLDWCQQPRKGWHLVYVFPVLVGLLILSRILGKVNDENSI